MASTLNSTTADVSEPIESNMFQKTLDEIIQHFSLTEVLGDTDSTSGPFLSCDSRFGLVPNMAKVRVYIRSGNSSYVCPIEKLVHIELNCPQLGLTSNMLYAFTESYRPLPHFTLDVVKRGKTYGLHCDLIPRASQGMGAPNYFQEMYLPLMVIFKQTQSLAQDLRGLAAYKLRKSQMEVMSPLLLCYLADNEDDYAKLGPAVSTYLEQWLHVLDNGIDSNLTGYSPTQLSENDIAHRAQIFSPKVDPVWLFVRLLIGQRNEEAIRNILCSQNFWQ